MTPDLQEVAEKMRTACHELGRRLRNGEDASAEDFLGSHPQGDEYRDAILELLYTEFVVRQELGQQPDPADWYHRFPQWKSDLAELFEVHRYVCEHEGQPPTAGTEPAISHGDTRHESTCSGEPPWRPFLRGYALLEEIGSGGMGIVYKARQLSVNRLVAIKMILSRSVGSGADDARFRLEAEAAASLHHPHIAQVFEAGEQDGQPFLVMEFVAGPSLENVLAKAPLRARSAAELLLPLAEAIDYAHRRGIIHRDLKPSNILLTPDGQPKITDFGLARRLDDNPQARVTQAGVVLGTPAYMPPEQAAGNQATVSPVSDVYALGAILYETVTGRPPYVADNLAEILQQIRLTDPVRPRRLNPHFPKDLETICLKCLEKQPAARYQSAAALADELRRFLNGEAIHACPTRWWERGYKWSRRRPAIAALLALILVVTSLGVSGVYWQTRKALLEAQMSLATKKFFGGVLESINPALARGRSITVREVLDEVAAQLTNTDIHPRIQAGLHDSLGITYGRIGELVEAENHLRMAWQLYGAQKGPGDPDTLKMVSSLALVLKQLDRLTEAELLARQGMQTARRSLGNSHAVTQLLRTNLAVTVDALGRKEEAEQLYRYQLDHYMRVCGPRHHYTLMSMSNLGAWLMNNGRQREAEQLIDRCWKLQCEVLGDDHPETLMSMQNLSSVLTNLGRAKEAVAIGEDLLEFSRRVLGPTALLTLRREETLAKSLFSLDRTDEAITLGQHAFHELRDRLGTAHYRVLSATETLVMLLGLSDQLAKAESIALRSYTEVSSELGPAHPSATRMARLLANLYEDWERPADQEQWQAIANGDVTVPRESPGTAGN